MPRPTPPAAAVRWPPEVGTRIVAHGGFRTQVVLVGEGPPLLALHGTGASSHSFRRLLPLLTDHYTVVVPDLPGQADSRAPSSFRPSLDGFARVLSDLLEALELAPEVVVGHSAGAAILARMILDGAVAPRLFVGLAAALVPFRGVTRVVLPAWARVLSRGRLAPFIAARAGARIDRVIRGTGSVLSDEDLELYRRLVGRPAHVAAVLAMLRGWELEPLHVALPRLDTDVLLLAGDRDRAVPLSQQREIAARLPRARLVVVPGTGHLLHEERPGRICEIIQQERPLPPRA